MYNDLVFSFSDGDSLIMDIDNLPECFQKFKKDNRIVLHLNVTKNGFHRSIKGKPSSIKELDLCKKMNIKYSSDYITLTKENWEDVYSYDKEVFYDICDFMMGTEDSLIFLSNKEVFRLFSKPEISILEVFYVYRATKRRYFVKRSIIKKCDDVTRLKNISTIIELSARFNGKDLKFVMHDIIMRA